VARMYRGEHHPTDILGSLLFAALWLTATSMLVKPTKDSLDHAGRRPLVLPSRASQPGLAADPVSVGPSERRRTV
jgi:undecaprenyl-diphosphatase